MMRRRRRRRTIIIPPPPKIVVLRFEDLLKNRNWKRLVREKLMKRTPYVTSRSIEIVTALYVYEYEGGYKGLSLKHLKHLIPNLSHAQMHRLGDFLVTRVAHNGRRYSYYLDPRQMDSIL